jgi:capsular exopolysaccharide synthesis family protein
MDPAELMRALRRRWLLVVTTVLAALVAAWLTTAVVPAGPPLQNYRATSVILSDTNTSFGFSTGYNLQTIAALAKVGKVPERVATSIGYGGDPVVLAERISSSGNTETGLLKISAASTDPEEARVLADEFATQLLSYMDERTGLTSTAKGERLQERIRRLESEAASLSREIGSDETGDELLVARRNAVVSELTSLYQQQQQIAAQAAVGPPLTIIQPAVPIPVEGSGFIEVRSLPSRLVLSALLGLLASVGLVFLRERFDTRIHTKEAAEGHFDLPVLAEIPYVREWRRRPSVAVLTNPKSPIADSFRLLAAGVTRRPPKPPQAILITGPGPGEGKSTVVANLAAAFAEVGKRVLVLSCDLHRPTIHMMFGVPNTRGLSDALISKQDGHTIVNGQGWRTAMPNVRLVPSGRIPEKPGELLSSPLMRQVIAEAREAADVVIIDTAPILAASDASHLFPLVDAVVVVGRAGRTTAQSARRSSELLLRLGAPVVGAALNGSTDGVLPRGYHDYYADGRRRLRMGRSRQSPEVMAGLTDRT